MVHRPSLEIGPTGQRAVKLVQRRKVIATKPDDLSLVPGTPMVEGENQLLSHPMTPTRCRVPHLCLPAPTHAHPTTPTHTKPISVVKIKRGNTPTFTARLPLRPRRTSAAHPLSSPKLCPPSSVQSLRNHEMEVWEQKKYLKHAQEETLRFLSGCVTKQSCLTSLCFSLKGEPCQ